MLQVASDHVGPGAIAVIVASQGKKEISGGLYQICSPCRN